MLEVFTRIFDNSFVQRTKIRRAKAEWIVAGEMVKVPVYELPIKAVVIGNEHWPILYFVLEPISKFSHYDFWLVKLKRFFTSESTHFERIRNPRIRNRLQATIKCACQSRLN